MSSVLTVTEPAAVKLLTQGRARWVLGEFLKGENRVASVARALGADIRPVHRDVLALLDARLLRLVREEKRAGRPVKVYAAAASAFFVPFSVTDAPTVGELLGRRKERYDEQFDLASSRKFQALHDEQGGGREWGVRVYLDPQGQVGVDSAYEGAELVDHAVRYQGPVGLMLDIRADVRLTESEAQEVQMELIKVLMRLRQPTLEHTERASGQPFLLRLGLVGVTEEEMEELR